MTTQPMTQPMTRCAMLGCLLAVASSALSAADCPLPPAATRLEPGAAATLQAAERALDAGDPRAPATIEARIQRAEVYRATGRPEDAARDLDTARAAARAGGQERLWVLATQALGQVRHQQGQNDRAAALLREALDAARRLDSPLLIAASASALGAVRHDQGQTAEAAALWREALTQARAANDPGLEASIRIQQARLASSPARALDDLRAARAAAERAETPDEQAGLLLTIAEQARRQAPGAAGTALAEACLRTATERARPLGPSRLLSGALGATGALRAEQGRAAEARRLAAEALQTAPLDAYDLRYRWEWQLGRLLRQEGDRDRAIAAYRRAVDHLQRIRQNIPIEYAGGRSSFRETLEPLYLGLADLLLQASARTGEGAARQALLREARDTVEQIKLDELRDYFRDLCILPLREEVGALSPRAAVLYPIILPDRLELLVGIGDRLHQATVAVAQDEITGWSELLALKLRYDQPAEEEAARLYDWLITPIASRLAEQRIETLVFVPGGPLRAVPLAALRHDGVHLVEHYAVATVPGLRLLQPETLSKTGLNTLLAGLSRPGPVVNELPGWWVDAMVRQNRGTGRGAPEARGISVGVRGARRGDPEPPLRGVTDAEKIEALALPGVAEEIDRLSERLTARTLRDREFVLDRFVGELADRPYRVVHIASHGLFQGPPEENFIMTYDRKLDMKTLAAALKPRELSQQPIEILVLSACQTAEGDDRTPLGLSGVALQAGARSALGSLWPVGDAATKLLMQAFYEALKEPGMTKARALQQAQRSLLADERYRRPGDWAAFILVGNWL